MGGRSTGRRDMPPAPWPSVSLLGALPRETGRALLSLGTPRTYGPGSTLMNEGDRTTHVVLVLDGCVKVMGTTAGGRPSLLAIRAGGDLVGEQAALDGGNRSATVVSASHARTRDIGQREFLGFLHTCPGAALVLSQYVSAKLRRSTRYRVDLGGSPVLARLCRVLLELADSHGRRVPDGLLIGLPLTQPELAALVGAAVPSLERAIRLLRDEGVLTTGYRRLVLHDSEALNRRLGEPSLRPGSAGPSTAAGPDTPVDDGSGRTEGRHYGDRHR